MCTNCYVSFYHFFILSYLIEDMIKSILLLPKLVYLKEQSKDLNFDGIK